MNVSATTLPGRFVTLEPLRQRHAADILEVLSDRSICRFLRWGPFTTLAEAQQLSESAEKLETAKQALPFAIVLNESGRTIGSNRYLDIRPEDRQLEIGSTFLARRYWGSAASIEHGYMLVRHCFEQLNCMATKAEKC